VRTLRDKVVVITGAGSGIGRALAVHAAVAGAVPALSDVDEPGLRETAELVLAATGRRPRTDAVDVRDRAAVHDYAGAVSAGLGRVDVVVNNAGVALHGGLEEVGYHDLEWVMDVDFWGVVHGTKEFLPHLVASGDGCLVNLSSLFGIMGMAGQTAYCSAKFAVRGFTESLRLELLLAGTPVQVTCVHPGGVRTAIVRHARISASHDKADVERHFEQRLARTTPEQAARAIWAGVLAGRARVLVGADAKALDVAVRLLGSGYQRLVTRVMRPTGPRPLVPPPPPAAR